MKESIRYLSLCGLLGYGYAPVSLKNALMDDLDFVGVDAGSTDPGPYYLGSGKGFVKRLHPWVVPAFSSFTSNFTL